MSATPRTTFHIIRTESCVTENAATFSVGACLPSVATSSACVCPTPPGVIAKSPESMCEEATSATVYAVTGMSKAAMKTTLTPMRQQYEALDGSTTSLA